LLKENIIQQRFTLKKEERLKSKKLIENLFKDSTSFSIFPLRILYTFLEKNIAPLQTGFAVSKKMIKTAVDRNRIKRLMREAYRLQNSDVTENLKNNKKFLVIFFIYTGNQIPKYEDVFDKTKSALKRLNKIVDESIVTGP